MFGIGAAVQGACEIYFRSARRSGRTLNMINTVKEGDRIIVLSNVEGDRIKRFLKERKIEHVDVKVVDPKRPEEIFQRMNTPQGRSIFDHSWVEAFYMNGIFNMQKNLEYFQVEASGYGEKHIQTRLQAEAISKWEI